MKFNLLVSGGLYSSQSAYSALQFCRSALDGGHEISQVFFYQDGVTQATALSVPLADEFEPVNEWVQLSEQFGLELVVCVSAAERRGVLSESQSLEFGKAVHNLEHHFRVEGLGALHDASLNADRTVTFK